MHSVCIRRGNETHTTLLLANKQWTIAWTCSFFPWYHDNKSSKIIDKPYQWTHGVFVNFSGSSIRIWAVLDVLLSGCFHMDFVNMHEPNRTLIVRLIHLLWINLTSYSIQCAYLLLRPHNTAFTERWAFIVTFQQRYRLGICSAPCDLFFKCRNNIAN